MITVFVNNQPLDIAVNCPLSELPLNQLPLSKLALNQENSHFAIAINQNFIPRGLYQQTVLQPGDRIELLVPMQGG